ncbi:sensor diguanylate cyclase/phosphoesterase, PAS, PAS and Hist_Kin_Sens domain-containing [Syntrophotalea carbinolica DSM 2380]|uniref:Sensor diguanylate cyclase/phosphoesterase, PAS, PAS and Hist_Kin_Sens domain-containing n=1 Tax=Syntrophotalea carbinolica (strain DSM 2380 / NBRC 103641 / GraBd1) TaxID=338963 RepID=Q3A6D2_SYNC1|nr:EAL domain-containing protein [Syntrophotalea carbinolica]ABA88075.1 sensor diguanylate cyclase/phosphoesterase, PAS, PAS and Hist_Kin_Sens domain-containing [Syntrophotalea carbinolica DSM 2380]
MRKRTVQVTAFPGNRCFRRTLLHIVAPLSLCLLFLVVLQTTLPLWVTVALCLGLLIQMLAGWHGMEEYRRGERLRADTQRNQLHIENAISAIAVQEIVLDTDGQAVDFIFLSANPAFETHTGLKVADILGRRVTEVLPGIEKTHYIESFGKVALTGEVLIFEEYSDLLGRHFRIHAYPLGEKCFATMFSDITESHNAKEALQENQSLIQSLLRSMQDLVFVLDTDLVFQTYHQPACGKLFVLPEQFIGKHLDEVNLPEEVVQATKTALEHTLTTGTVTHTEYWLDLPDGRTCFDMCISPYRAQNRQIKGLTCVARDITERKQAEETLEKRIQALTRPLHDAAETTFEELFNLKDIQQLQADFAQATGVAAIITQPDGTAITAPSNFGRLCKDIICKTAKGQANCRHSRALLGQPSNQAPTIRTCFSAGLWEAGAAILAGEHHIANWLVGQVRDKTQSEEQMRAYARKIGADETVTIEAFREVPAMTRQQFAKVAQALYSMSRHLSVSAYQNMLQARFISEQNKAQKKIAYLAHYDQLTGLANRSLLKERFDYAVRHAMRSGSQVALCLLDLDGFKAINDLQGHHVGDQLLCEVAKRLQTSIRSTDMAARIGGDEFVILFTDMQKTSVATTLVQKAMSCFTSAYDLQEHTHTITASMGVAIFPEDGHDFPTLFKHADAAMYFAKESGRNGVQFFRQEIGQRVQNRLTMETELRQALQEDQLELHYQPIWQLTEKCIVGLEALVRWRHPQKGLLPPDRFIPIAEESNLIQALGQWVLNAACRDMRSWRNQGFESLPVSVNISARQLFHDDFTSSLARLLKEYALPPEQLELEVTETIFLQKDTTVEKVMNHLKNIGVGLVLDDFGTGYSSLSYLNRFHIDKLKIDRSFMAHICQKEQDAILTATIIRMAQSLGMQVVAEGVETAGQELFLMEQGCDLAQGYFYYKPQPIESLRDIFVQNKLCSRALEDPEQPMPQPSA